MNIIRSAILLAWFVTLLASQTHATEPQWSLLATAGHSTNVFDSPEQKSDRYFMTRMGFRGTIGHNEQQAALGLSVSSKKFATYGFADEHVVEGELAYKNQLTDNLVMGLEAAFAHQDGGDLFASIGGTDIGYRVQKNRLALGLSLAVESAMGTTGLATRYRSTENGKARFNQPGLLSVRLEPQYAEHSASIRHDVALGSHSIGAKVSWRRSLIPEDDRELYVRYPAQVTDMSAVWNAGFGEGFALTLEGGSALLLSEQLDEDAGWYPFYSAEAKWALGDRATISAGIGRSLVLSEIDDAVAEDVTRGVLRIDGRLSETMEAVLMWEHSANHQLYFDYPTRSRSLSAGLTWKLGPALSAEFTYANQRHDEFDRALSYSGREITASLSASF